MVYDSNMEQMQQAFVNPYFAMGVGMPQQMMPQPGGHPMGMPPNFANMPAPVPPGLSALYGACRAIYPAQANPLQVAAVLKYWLGGPDPLDYISMFANPGNPETGIPPHWHYVSFGLSDLHGDGRVHEMTPPNNPSGFGFELSFRLKKEIDESSPPTWPAAVMQSLAKYVFQSENLLCPGDHVSWHCSLDNSDSEIQHMLMTEDAQLGTVLTPFGPVTFIQIVGVCVSELQAAQKWNGPGLIDAMKGVEGAGGPWLVTDMRRGASIFELDPEVLESVEDGIAAEGSNLSGVTAKCSWTEKKPGSQDGRSESGEEIEEEESKQEKQSNSDSDGVLSKSLIASMGHEDDNDVNRSTLSPTASRSKVCSRSSRHSAMSVAKDDALTNLVAATSRMSFVSGHEASEAIELTETKFLPSVQIKLNLEAGILLPLVFRGRLKHGRHFTFKTVAGDLAITFMTEAVSGAYAKPEQPFALHGPWLQILIASDRVESLLGDLHELTTNPELLQLPKSFEWPDLNLSIVIAPEDLQVEEVGT